MVYELEPYIRTVNNLDERKCLSRNNKLEIEVGRHKKKTVDERLCTVCHVVEDEIYFLIDCPKYDDARNSLFVHIQNNCNKFNTLDSKEKTIYLMSTGDDECMKRVSSYVYKCMNQNVNNIERTSQNGSNSHEVGFESY